jgi:tRNA(fMet)-specific endonuclease VapC
MIDATLDTVVLVDLIRKQRQAQEMVGRFAHLAASHVVLGELLLGGLKTTRLGEMNKISVALEGVSILDGDADTAGIYARLRWRLEEEGIPIPQNDLWIAAASIRAGVPLITRDRHFRRVSGLTVLEY